MPDSVHQDDVISQQAAKRAAKKAIAQVALRSRLANKNRVGRVALYTWGTLAVASALFASAAGFFQSSLPDSMIVAGSSTSMPQPASVQLQTDLQPTLEEQLVVASLPGIGNHLDRRTTGSIGPESTELRSTNAPQITASIAPQKEFGVDIGGSQSLPSLTARFAALQRRAPDLFDALKPVIQLNEDDVSLQARLIAGPFTSKQQVSSFCRSVKLRFTIDCSETNYVGTPIEESQQ